MEGPEIGKQTRTPTSQAACGSLEWDELGLSLGQESKFLSRRQGSGGNCLQPEWQLGRIQLKKGKCGWKDSFVNKDIQVHPEIVYKAQFLLSSCPNILRANVQNGPVPILHRHRLPEGPRSYNRASSLSRGKGIKYATGSAWTQTGTDWLGTFPATLI